MLSSELYIRKHSPNILESQSEQFSAGEKNGTADKRKGSERKISRKLTPEERQRIYQELCSPEYKDLNPNEIYNSLLDKGIYLASSRTFYRILKEFNAIYHRTEDRKGNSKKHPVIGYFFFV